MYAQGMLAIRRSDLKARRPTPYINTAAFFVATFLLSCTPRIDGVEVPSTPDVVRSFDGPSARDVFVNDAQSADSIEPDARFPADSISSADVTTPDVVLNASDAASRDVASRDVAALDDAGPSVDVDAIAFDVAPSADVVSDAGRETVAQSVRAWVWNVAGHTMHGGATDDGLIEAAASSIVARDVDFVGFNELCFSQYRALQDELRARNWPQGETNFSRFAEGRPAGTAVCGGSSFGNAIFSRAPLGAASRMSLPEDEGSAEIRTLLCAPLLDTPHLRWCTTHVTTSSEVGTDGLAANVRQLMFIQDQLRDWHEDGDTVLIGGDFNAQPQYRRLDRFYSRNINTAVNGDNRGVHRELDDLDPCRHSCNIKRLRRAVF